MGAGNKLLSGARATAAIQKLVQQLLSRSTWNRTHGVEQFCCRRTARLQMLKDESSYSTCFGKIAPVCDLLRVLRENSCSVCSEITAAPCALLRGLDLESSCFYVLQRVAPRDPVRHLLYVLLSICSERSAAPRAPGEWDFLLRCVIALCRLLWVFGKLLCCGHSVVGFLFCVVTRFV